MIDQFVMGQTWITKLQIYSKSQPYSAPHLLYSRFLIPAPNCLDPFAVVAKCNNGQYFELLFLQKADFDGIFTVDGNPLLHFIWFTM